MKCFFPLKIVQTCLSSIRPQFILLQSMNSIVSRPVAAAYPSLDALHLGSCYLKQVVASTCNTQARYTGLVSALLDFIEKYLHEPKHHLMLSWVGVLWPTSDDSLVPLLAFM